MLIIGTFAHSPELEQALVVLEESGIPREHIMMVPMNSVPTSSQQYMGKSRGRYYKGIDTGMACATACTVIGLSIGYILTWGPIFWAMIGACTGFAGGFGIFLFFNKNGCRNLPGKLPEVTVIVQCPEKQSLGVKEIMWKYRVLTVGGVPGPF